MQIILAFDLELTNQFYKVNTFFWKVIEFIGFDWSPQGHKAIDLHVEGCNLNNWWAIA